MQSIALPENTFRSATSERSAWAGHNTTLLAVYDGSDTLVARFEYGVGRMPVRMTVPDGQNSGTYYFAYDQVGSLRAVFDDAGVLVHEITYDSYGNIITDETTSGFESVYIPPFGFAGGLHDRDTGMVLFGFRDYDPETGTWLTPDPIGFAGGDTYLYGYCGGDPVNLVDPDGLLTVPVIGDLGVFGDSVWSSVTFGYGGNSGPLLVQAHEVGGAVETATKLSLAIGLGAAGAATCGYLPSVGGVISGSLTGTLGGGITSMAQGKEGTAVLIDMGIGTIAIA